MTFRFEDSMIMLSSYGHGGGLMATADQVKALIKAHMDHDEERFKTTVLQVAAYEAKLGHEVFARELKELAGKSLLSRPNIIKINQQNPILHMTIPSDRLFDLVVSNDLYNRIQRILDEFRNRNRLQKYGLSNRRKILLEGKPGTGKTFTAAVIASELGLPLYTIQMDKLVTKFMGETSAKLRQVFDSIESSMGVYFFDEFDAIGADRSLDNEVGEMRRILNSFLQFIEQESSESIIIAATNNQKLLDQALFRRFDDVLHYSMPSRQEVKKLFEIKLTVYCGEFKASDTLIDMAMVLSHAEIIRVCDDAIKHSILNGADITEQLITLLINERTSAYSMKEA